MILRSSIRSQSDCCHLLPTFDRTYLTTHCREGVPSWGHLQPLQAFSIPNSTVPKRRVFELPSGMCNLPIPDLRRRCFQTLGRGSPAAPDESDRPDRSAYVFRLLWVRARTGSLTSLSDLRTTEESHSRIWRSSIALQMGTKHLRSRPLSEDKSHPGAILKRNIAFRSQVVIDRQCMRASAALRTVLSEAGTLVSLIGRLTAYIQYHQLWRYVPAYR